MGFFNTGINTRYNASRTFNPTVYSGATAGAGFGTGDDFLSPSEIGGITTGFSQSVSPVRTTNPFLLGYEDIFSHNAKPEDILISTADFLSHVRPPAHTTNQFVPNAGNPYSHNAPPGEILLGTNNVVYGISPVDSNAPSGLFELPAFPYPSIQPIPNMGRNPHPLTLLSGTTQVQGDILSVGANAIPGYPIIDFGSTPSAMDFMGGTEAFIDAIAPLHNRHTGQGAIYPTTVSGQYLHYRPPAIQPPTGPYFNNYPHFAPYHGSHVVPTQVPYPWQNTGYNYSSYNQTSVGRIVNLIRSLPRRLPDFIPYSGRPSSIIPKIQRYTYLPESYRVQLREDYANPTSVDMDILNSAGIDGNGGTYGQGQVNNPFIYEDFLTDTNPFAQTGKGMVVTNGNDNGKVKGTPVSDMIIGTEDRNNIIDGRGGQDDVVGSSKNDLVNVHHGDRVYTNGGNDLMFFDFTADEVDRRITSIDGGESEDDQDILVLTVDGDASVDENQPAFRQLGNGVTSILSNGIEVLSKNIERYIVVDQNGQIGGIYDVG